MSRRWWSRRPTAQTADTPPAGPVGGGDPADAEQARRWLARILHGYDLSQGHSIRWDDAGDGLRGHYDGMAAWVLARYALPEPAVPPTTDGDDGVSRVAARVIARHQPGFQACACGFWRSSRVEPTHARHVAALVVAQLRAVGAVRDVPDADGDDGDRWIEHAGVWWSAKPTELRTREQVEAEVGELAPEVPS